MKNEYNSIREEIPFHTLDFYSHKDGCDMCAIFEWRKYSESVRIIEPKIKDIYVPNENISHKVAVFDIFGTSVF